MTESDLRRHRNAIRREMRARRRALAPHERVRADRALRGHIRSLTAFRAARRIGVYIPFDGEPDLRPLIDGAAGRAKKFFVPVLANAEMRFVELPRRPRLARNFFGILEPRAGRAVDARTLDLVLTPLVAFDARGTRLGVGRGYYDRHFAFLSARKCWLKPKLLGIGYALQEVATLEVRPWDVPLWGVATEKGVQRCAQAVRP
ncbi:MAG TPA: 5-formyltetrahydrofolate cyclo-ligase [Gammaproteobacteria bacterium]|jgi:5-formyltetrahydrofolate cyclo-ligase